MIRFRREPNEGGDDGCEGIYRKEICCAVSGDERDACHADPEGEEPGAKTDEGADPVGGGRPRPR
jgi:hypothetical protein